MLDICICIKDEMQIKYLRDRGEANLESRLVGLETSSHIYQVRLVESPCEFSDLAPKDLGQNGIVVSAGTVAVLETLGEGIVGVWQVAMVKR